MITLFIDGEIEIEMKSLYSMLHGWGGPHWNLVLQDRATKWKDHEFCN